MAHLLILTEPGDDPEVIEGIRRDWLLYGEVHITNAKGLTRLDPAGITYSGGGIALRDAMAERERLMGANPITAEAFRALVPEVAGE